MESILSYEDRLLIAALTAELKRMNDRAERSDQQPEFVFSVGQAAAYLGVTRQTISRKVRENKLEKIERGGVIGFLKSDLDKIKPAATAVEPPLSSHIA